MTDAPMLQALAEAVIDGSDPDWDAAESSAPDAHARALVRHLRAVSLIGRERASVYSTGLDSAIGEVPLDLPPGSTWGSLRALEQVGRGRFGDVYRAWDPTLDREVALKILRRRDGPGDDSHVVHEGRLMARVRHPNVVTIYGAQRIAGRTGLWMEFIHGRTLEAELAERGPMDATELTRIGRELCAALEAVHTAGLVHRDVKAQNVLREQGGRIVLGDFGTGRELDEASTERPELAGTPAYLAPEVFERQPATAQSDIYSLGTLLFHLATCDYPVKGRTIAALRAAHQSRQTTTLRSARTDLPVSLAAAVDRALAADPSRRFARAADLAAALEPSRRDSPPRVRARLVAAGVVVAAVVALALAGVVTRGTDATTGPAATPTWVLVTAAINRTSESVLDGTIEYALERELSQSPVINVATRPRVADVLRLMQKPPDTPLDPATSREVALRDGGIRALVTGRVEKIGDAFSVSVDLINPSDGALFASVGQSPVSQAELLKAIGRTAIDVRRRLGEGLQSTEASRLELAKVTTPSLKALQLYSQAVALQDEEGTFGGRATAAVAEQLLRAAIAEDPAFASAHMTLSIAIRGPNPERLGEALEQVKQGIALSNNVTEIERLVNEAELSIQARMTPDPAERRRWNDFAIAKYEAVLRLQPNHAQALICLTNLYVGLSQPNARVAMPLADLRPQSSRWTAEAVSAALWAGDLGAARKYARRQHTVTRTPAGLDVEAWLRLFDAYDAWLRNDAVTALAVADRVAEGLDSLPEEMPNPRSWYARQLARLYTMLGRLDAAEAMATHIETRNGRRSFERISIARHRGDPNGLWEVFRREYPRLEEATGQATVMIEAGRLEEARIARDRMQGRSDTYPMFIDGQIALSEGRPDEAADKIETHLRAFPPRRGHYIAVKLADALAAQGEPNRAITLLESFSTERIALIALPGAVIGSDWLPLRDRLALLYRQVGRHRDADAIDAELRALLAVADQDHPIKRRLEDQVR